MTNLVMPKALPKIAEAATSDELKEALTSHLEETKGHIEKVGLIFAAFGEKSTSKECKATVGMLAEGDALIAENKGEPTLNSAIIAACQKVENYEIASYRTLMKWAGMLRNEEAADLLEEILNEEEEASEKLGELAGDNNQEALGDEADTDDDEKSDNATGRN